MNILTKICHPKEQHFEQEARTQAYKPINDYVFENRSMQKMRARHQAIQNPEEYKYQSWNHPYSISNFFMQQKGTINGNTKQSLGGTTDYISHPNELALMSQQSHVNKKISFKQFPQTFCGMGKEEEQGEKLFTKREDFFASLRTNNHSDGNSGFAYQGRNYNHHEDTHFMHNDNQRIQNLQNELQSSQNNHAYVLLNQQILRLKQQNKDLKRIVEEEYKPMKELYNKLLSEQQERQYLISKLEWKVKELVKDMGAASGSFGTGTTVQVEQKNNFDTKRENKFMSRVDSEKQFGQNSVAQPFKTFQTNFSNIQIQENQAKTYTNLQTPYKNLHQNNAGGAKPFEQINYASPTGIQNYQSISTLQTGRPSFQSPYSSPQQFNTHSYQNYGIVQPNHYISNGNSHFPQTNNYPTISNNFLQNYQKPSQNLPITPTFNQTTGYQAHYNQKFNF